MRISRQACFGDVDEVSRVVAQVEPVERTVDLAESPASTHGLVEIGPSVPIQIRGRDTVEVPNVDAPGAGGLTSQRVTVLVDADGGCAAVIRCVEIEEAPVAGREKRHTVAEVGEGGADACGDVLEV